MNDNQFDHIIKNKLEQYASKLPDDMWDRIKSKDKKRRIFFVPRRYFLVLFLMIGLTTGYFLFNKNADLAENSLVLINENSENDLTNNKGNTAISLQKDSINHDSFNVATINSIQPEELKQKTKLIFDNVSAIDLPENKMQEERNIAAEYGIQDKDADHEDNHKQAISPEKKEDTLQNKLSSNVDPVGDEKKQDDEEPERFAIEFYASPDLPFGKFSSSYGNYEQLKNSSTNFRLSYTLGTRLDMFITKHFVARSGLQYSVINEKFSTTDSMMHSKTSNNHYKSLDIPLLLAYYTEKKNFAAMFSTGIVLNLTSSYEGYLPGADGSIVNLGSTKMYKSNTGVSLYFGASFSKPLNTKTDLFAEPYLKYRLNNMAAGFEPFTQKINTAGISLGIKYRFFKNPD